MWTQTYGGQWYDEAYSLVEASDGGYALAGSTGSSGEDYQDFWLIKTDDYDVIPETSWVILPLLLAATLSIFIIKKRLLHTRS
jgi:hypothetical protein